VHVGRRRAPVAASAADLRECERDAARGSHVIT
jgi:hypothetical protein